MKGWSRWSSESPLLRLRKIEIGQIALGDDDLTKRLAFPERVPCPDEQSELFWTADPVETDARHPVTQGQHSGAIRQVCAGDVLIEELMCPLLCACSCLIFEYRGHGDPRIGDRHDDTLLSRKSY